MPTNVIMPALGMAQETGKVLKWLKGEGETVAKGEPLLEVETDKATVELEAPAAGILTRVTASAGDVVPVGRVIAAILAPGESVTQPAASPRPTPAPAPAGPAAPSLPTPSTGKAQSASAPAPSNPQRVAASPKARRLARERGVDLAGLSGSGPGGAIVAGDVAGTGRAEAIAPGPSIGTVWRLMAERTTQSWTTTPHFFLLREVEASALATWRSAFSAVDLPNAPPGSVTYTDLLVSLAAGALREHPRLNARWEAGGIVNNDAINISLAVATDAGLVAPVIYHADRLKVSEIAQRRRELVERAQAGKLRPDDLRDGTFTISNLGMYAIDAFTAIINAPQAAILAVGRIAPRVVAVDGEPAVRPMLVLSLSCDHRVVDGARAAQFLATLANLIEEPSRLQG